LYEDGFGENEELAKKVCWELAQAGEAFEVPDVTPKQILFLQELCSAYRGKHKVLGNRLQIHFASSRTKDVNDEIEANLKEVLQKIIDSKKKPNKELVGICARYIGFCLEKGNLSEKTIEMAERILDVMEFSAKQ
jgi:hypothetical protein